MEIWTADKILLFFIFFIPGFISTQIFEFIIPSDKRDFSKTFLQIIAYSALNYSALSWLIYIVVKYNYYLNTIVIIPTILIVFFIMPILWPFIIKKAFSFQIFADTFIHPIAKPWDYYFAKRESCWVIVHLKNGTSIGGIYDENSFASSYPAKEQIYLEQVWEIDDEGVFLKPVDRSKGIIILGDDISSIEFFTTK